MNPRILAPLALIATLGVLPGCSDKAAPDAAASAGADKLAGLAIEWAKAEAVADIPIGSVPGTITLPPEARVAVTAPFAGAAVRVYVIAGQNVRRGEPLAVVRATEPVQIQGELVRAQSELGLAEARANRLAQLATEGVIAQARADEARAALAQAQSVSAWLRQAAAGNPDETGAASVPYLRLLSQLLYCFMWCRMAVAATLALSRPGVDKAFYEDKLTVARFFMVRLMPVRHALAAEIMSGCAAVMALPAERF